MKDLLFECLWNKPDAETRERVKTMWRRHQALANEALMEQRSQEIVFVVRNKAGEVGAVSTVRTIRVKAFNNHYFYEFRCFISPPFSAPGLDSMLVARTKSFLEGCEDSGAKYKGLLMVIENEQIKKQRTKAIWPAAGMVFAGYTAKGHHVRVGYFKGVTI